MSNRQRILQGISISGALVAVSILCLLVIGIFVSGIYANNSEKRKTTPILIANEISLQFDYPQYLYLQDKPVDLRVNVWTENGLLFSEPLMVRLEIPEGFQVITPTSNTNDRVVLLTFPPQNGLVQNEQVYLQNAGTVTATQTQKITAESSLHQKTPPMGVRLNSPKQSAFFNFFRNALSSNGPILLAVATITAVMTGLLQYYSQRAELARVEAEELNRQRLEKARELANKIREYLIKGNVQGIERVWQELSRPDILHTLQTYEQQWLQRLVSIAVSTSNQGRIALEDFDEALKNIQAEWPDEVAGAILCSYKNSGRAVDES